MPKRKLVKIETIRSLFNLANDQLGSSLSQAMKEQICFNLERLLHDTGYYRGYNYNYWLDIGCEKWNKSGQFEGHKERYIIGPEGVEEKQNENFVSARQGEYSRTYYIHSELH